MSNTNWSDSGTPANSIWRGTSGYDTPTYTYDDATITYDQATMYYDGFNPSVILPDDVKYSAFTDAQTPATSAWTDIT